MTELGSKHSFTLAGFRSFEWPVTHAETETINRRVKDARLRPRLEKKMA